MVIIKNKVIKEGEVFIEIVMFDFVNRNSLRLRITLIWL